MHDILLLSLGISSISLGFITGTIVGYKYKTKKIVPLVKFINKEDKKRVLKEYKIHLNESTKCAVCGDTITIENIGAVIPTKDGNIFLCSKSQCMTVGDLWKPIRKF